MNNWTSPILEIRFDMSGKRAQNLRSRRQSILDLSRNCRTKRETHSENDEVGSSVNWPSASVNWPSVSGTSSRREREAEHRRAERMAAQLRAMGIEPEE